MNSLLYKIQNDPYYHDVRLDYNALDELPKIEVDTTCMINVATLKEVNDDTKFRMLERGRKNL